MPLTLFDYICAALPNDIKPKELTSFGKPEWWRQKPAMAAAYALRKHPRINWQAYGQTYADVKEAGIDPVLHFIKHGACEGRKLKSWSKWHRLGKDNDGGQAPKASIVIVNCGNGLFLEKCICSLMGQTLAEIEIILVDDASDDGSLAIACKLQSRDPRIKIIALPLSEGRHNARKIGVRAATGDYIMFVDSHDFLSPEACEAAWRAAAKGFDMAGFKANLISIDSFASHEIAAANQKLNCFPAGEYQDEDFFALSFVDGKLPWKLGLKIVERGLCQFAFNLLEDERLNGGGDAYAFMAISAYARNYAQINDKIYNYSFCNDAEQFPAPRQSAQWAHALDFIKPAERLCLALGRSKQFLVCRERFLSEAQMRLGDLDSGEQRMLFDELVESCGVLDVVQALAVSNFMGGIEATRFLADAVASPSARMPRRIGILYYRLGPGGIERTIQNICRLLEPAGFEISLFLEEKSSFDMEVSSSIKRYYLAASNYPADKGRQHLADLSAAAEDSGIEVMLHMQALNHMLLWDTLLLRTLGIDVIASLRCSPNADMLSREKPYQHSVLLHALRCVNKVTCLSDSAEIYLRINGIDAAYLPNAIRTFDEQLDDDPDDIICVVARMSDRQKRVGKCLEVLRLVKQEFPGARMLFVGDFHDEKSRQRFYKKATALGVARNIRVTGWTARPGQFLAQSKLLFSSSYIEGFPNNIAEAQIMGLPVVMFDLDIAMAEDNEGIIRVAQDDVESAAKEICRLLRDDEERRRLSIVSQEKAARFSEERFRDSLIQLLDSYTSSSEAHFYSQAQYERALRWMTFYAGRGVPAD